MATHKAPDEKRPVVLIIEDELLQRMMAVDIVKRAGFEVLQATSAQEAIAILEERLDVRVVFTDIDLGKGMDGMALAALVRNRWPPIEFIFTSGHVTPGEEVLPHRSRFFAKPYRQNDLVEAIRGFVN